MEIIQIEFDLIRKFFQSHRCARQDVILGIGDDCALLIPPLDQQLAMSIDTLVESVHYYPETDPRAIGHKSLAVSLSDLAAMGATPAWVMLALTLDTVREDWIKAFCEGFFALLDKYPMALIGGNISSGPPSVTTQVTGFLPKSSSGMRRSIARPGDHIYVTGYLGDAAIALAGLQEKLNIGAQMSRLCLALDYPTPRVSAGLSLRDIANAAIDISDGLTADLGHILEQSNVGATLKVDHIPLSPTVKQLVTDNCLTWEQAIQYALTGGDDYELCFTVAPQASARIMIDCSYTYIGIIEDTPGLRLMHNGSVFEIGERTGYQHFGA